MSKDFFIAVDFDGTCVEHRFPEVGPDIPGAVESLRKFASVGAKIILWTMRSARGNPEEALVLEDAIRWFQDRGIPLFGVNCNPTQDSWTSSPKVYAHIYIDDAAAGCPLRESPHMGWRPMVDWGEVASLVWQQMALWRKANAAAK